jgi:phage terminase large subunit-like protein
MKKRLDLSAVAGNPVDFAKAFMRQANGEPLIPHIGQVELLMSIAAITVVICGRQWGKSVAMSIYVCWYAVTHKARQVIIVAPTLDQARIIFNEVAFQFRDGPLSRLVVGKVNEYPFPRIKLANGTEIHGRGANSPQFIRGKKAHLIVVDEAAFCKDQTITDTLEPMLTVTGKEKDSGLLMITTPFGLGAVKDYYDQAIDDTTGKMVAKHFTSYDNPHADRDFLERVKARHGEDSVTWKTEYLAEFVDDDLAVFPTSHIKWAYEHYPYQDDKGCFEHPDFPQPPEEKHKYVSGADLANVRDWFVHSTIDVTNPRLAVLVNMVRLQKKGYPEYKRIIREQHHRYNKSDTLIDATSLGESVVQDLGDIQAEGWKFSSQSKSEIVNELARMMAEHRLAIPFDRNVISELVNFQYEITKNKVMRMEAKKGHDDIVMSLALCAHLALIPRQLGLMQGVDLEKNAPQKPTQGLDPVAELFALEAF